jgi:hypothetical protein
MHRMKILRPWIYSGWFDLATILLPPFLILAALFCFQDNLLFDELNPILWLLLIVGVDVSHVYSTLYRTYFDPEARAKYKSYLWTVPLICFIISIILHSLGVMVFWTVMAYVAVFHFIRQQYGFLRIYSRNEVHTKWSKRLDGIIIYGCTLLPILYWHFSTPRHFNWFVEGDFFVSPQPVFTHFILWLYFLLIGSWVAVMIFRAVKSNEFNIPKNLFVFSTLVSWYFGIVYFDNDIAFTALNVVSHGIPYMALVWVYGKKHSNGQSVFGWRRWLYTLAGLPVFVGFIALVGYFEEGMWDALIWRDHAALFQWSYFLPKVDSELTATIVVAILALPQLTHYVLDGFIWKVSKTEVRDEIGLN